MAKRRLTKIERTARELLAALEREHKPSNYVRSLNVRDSMEHLRTQLERR